MIDDMATIWRIALISFFAFWRSVEATGSGGLGLDAKIEQGMLVAVLLNTSLSKIMIAGDSRAIFPERAGGFFIEIKNANGDSFPYCGMINQARSEEYYLEPGKEITFREDVWVLKGSHCLPKDIYSLRVKYYNYRTPPSGDLAGPVVSDWIRVPVN